MIFAQKSVGLGLGIRDSPHWNVIFCPLKIPFFPPKLIPTPKRPLLTPKFGFCFSLNVNFCPEIAIFNPKFVPLCPHFLCPKGTFSAPNPNLCSLKRLKLEFLTPKWDFIFSFFNFGKEVLNQNCGFVAQKKRFFFFRKYWRLGGRIYSQKSNFGSKPAVFNPKNWLFLPLNALFPPHNQDFCH